MISLEEAITIAKENSKGLEISVYMDSGESYIFPVYTPGGMYGSTYYYEVDKSTGKHGICSDFWFKLMTDVEFGKKVSEEHKIEEVRGIN